MVHTKLYVNLTRTNEQKQQMIAPTVDRAINELSDFFNDGQFKSVTLASGNFLDVKEVYIVAQTMLNQFGVNENGEVQSNKININNIQIGTEIDFDKDGNVDAKELSKFLATCDSDGNGILTDQEFKNGSEEISKNRNHFLNSFDFNSVSKNINKMLYEDRKNNEFTNEVKKITKEKIETNIKTPSNLEFGEEISAENIEKDETIIDPSKNKQNDAYNEVKSENQLTEFISYAYKKDTNVNMSTLIKNFNPNISLVDNIKNFLIQYNLYDSNINTNTSY